MNDGIGIVSGFLAQAFKGFRGGQNDQFDPSLLGLALHRVHDGEGAMESVADDTLSAFPGNLLFNGERRVAEFVAEFLGGFFLPFLNLSLIDDHVVLLRLAVDLDRAERELFDMHGCLGSSYLPLNSLCNSSGAACLSDASLRALCIGGVRIIRARSSLRGLCYAALISICFVPRTLITERLTEKNFLVLDGQVFGF